MAKTDMKLENPIVEDDDELASMWGTTEDGESEDEEGQESWLVDSSTTRIPGPIYMTGHASVRYTSGLRGNPAGHHYKVADMPEGILKAFQTLAKSGIATLTTIRHSGGTENEYWFISEPRYYILAHGTPNRAEIMRSVESQLGIAAGEFTNEVFDKDRKKTGELQRKTAVSVLAVEQHLYDAGYRNEDGTPGVIALRSSGQSSGELFEALRMNYAVVQKAVEFKKADLMAADPSLSEKQATKKATELRGQYWEYAQVIVAGQNYKEHKGEGGSSEVLPIVTMTPAKRDITREYVDSVYCGARLYKELFPLVIETYVTASGNNAKKPGGMAIDYCRSYVDAVNKNIEKFSGPNGERPKWGKRPAPPWWTNRELIEQGKFISAEYIRGGAATEESPKKELSYVDTAKAEFAKKRRFFSIRTTNEEEPAVLKLAEDGLVLCDKADRVLLNEIGADEESIEGSLRRLLKQAAEKQQAIALL